MVVCRLTYDVRSGAIRLSRYWDLQFHPDPSRRPHEAADELRHRLREAVKRRLVSDVPLGVFLSGGIDSSSVVAMMAEVVPARQIKTFNVAFTDRSFDESRFARTIAQRFGADHHEQVFDVREMLAALPEVFALLDEPLADASLLPTYLLSRFTRPEVTVALSGDGGDELLAGYPTFAPRDTRDGTDGRLARSGAWCRGRRPGFRCGWVRSAPRS
jgi:asparagine synthase (glutamine-hydrolysing)